MAGDWAPSAYIAVCGHQPERFEAAYRSGADAVVFDLDKPVPVAHKAYARQAVAEFLSRPQPLPTLVRINGPDTPYAWDDLAAVIGPGVSVLRLPRVESAEWVRQVARTVEQRREHLGLLPGIGLEVYPGTAQGLINLNELARATHSVWRLGLGEESLYASLGNSSDQALLLARLQTVQAARAAALPGPVQKSFLPHWSQEELRRSSWLGLQMGFTARTFWAAEHVGAWRQILAEFREQPILTASGQTPSVL